MAPPATAQASRTQTISPPPIPVSQPSPRFNQTTLDICIQHITSEKPEYISLYLHSVSYDITPYLINSIAKTSYTLDIPLENWKRVLEQTLLENKFTSKLIHGVPSLRNPPKEIYSYIFPFYLYQQIGQMLMPHFPPPFWDKLKK
jgi:hypothetical protein